MVENRPNGKNSVLTREEIVLIKATIEQESLSSAHLVVYCERCSSSLRLTDLIRAMRKKIISSERKRYFLEYSPKEECLNCLLDKPKSE